MIGGTGRCGTTILRKVFDNHPDIAIVPEWRFMIDPDGILDFYNTFSVSWSPYLFDMRLLRLEKMLKSIGKNKIVGAAISYGIRRLKWQKKLPYRTVTKYSEVMFVKNYCPDYNKIVDELIEELKMFRYKGDWFGKEFLQKNMIYYRSPFKEDELATIFRKFYNQIIDNVLTHKEKKYYIEKNTWNILWFDKILKILPESKLIHIYRDPRDVISSFMNQPWSPTDPYQASVFYEDIINYWWKIKSQIPKESYCEISLETLVDDTEATLRRLCNFIEVDWNQELLNIDLSHSHSGRWKKNLSPDQKKIINDKLSDVIANLGYED